MLIAEICSSMVTSFSTVLSAFCYYLTVSGVEDAAHGCFFKGQPDSFAINGKGM